MKKKYLLVGIGIILLAILICVGFSALSGEAKPPSCGNGICEANEACNACPQDCQDPNKVCCRKWRPYKDGRCANFDCAGDTNCPSIHPQKLRSGRFPKWSSANNLIAFDDEVNGNYEIFTMRPDGTEINCLTCDQPDLPRGHKGQPYWHPSGDYITFTAENANYERWNQCAKEHAGLIKPYCGDMTVVPGVSGRNNDVWIMTSDGEKAWKMTNTPESGGVIRPSFSPDGEMLYWNEEYSIEKHGEPPKWSLHKNNQGEEWGLWQIVTAAINFTPTGPQIGNISKVNVNKLYPNKVVIEGQGIQPDNKHLLFVAADTSETAGCCQWGGKQVFGSTHWSDVYLADLDGSNLKRVTNTPYLHDENPEFSPDGKKIAWMQTRWCVGKAGDVYIMNSDGTNPIRATHLYNPNCPKDYLGRYDGGAGDELDWSPDSQKIIFSTIVDFTKKYPYVIDDIYILAVESLVAGEKKIKPMSPTAPTPMTNPVVGVGEPVLPGLSENVKVLPTAAPTFITPFPESSDKVQIVPSKNIYQKDETITILVKNTGSHQLGYEDCPGPKGGVVWFERKADQAWVEDISLAGPDYGSKRPCYPRFLEAGQELQKSQRIFTEVPSGTYRAVFQYVSGNVYSNEFKIL